MNASLDTLQHTLETIEMLKVSLLIIEPALMRTESRGAQFRSDYPETKEEWLKNILVINDKESIKTKAVPIVEIK